LARPPNSVTCTNCRAPLYRQWWNDAAGGFECRKCGTLNPGAAPARTSVRLFIGLSVAVAVLFTAGAAMAFVVLRLYSEDGSWRAAAIAGLASMVGGFVVLIAGIVVAVRRKA